MPISLIAALTIPCSLLFAFSLMVLGGQIGEPDFDRRDRFRHSGGCGGDRPGEHPPAAAGGHGGDARTIDLIADATAEAVRPVAFSVLVIIVALIPLFTMQGVPGKVFAPMSETYGFALIGAFIFAILFAPVLASWIRPEKVRGRRHAAGAVAARALRRSRCAGRMGAQKTVLAIAGAALAATLVAGVPFPGRRVHAQAGGRELVGARDAAAGRFV